MTQVIINGANGNMGQEAVRAVTADPTLSLVAQCDKQDCLSTVLNKHTSSVVVDLTHPDVVYTNVHTALHAHCSVVVGTTGLSQVQLKELGSLAKDKNLALIVCPNFAIGAILMMRFAQQAAQVMDRCEIIEYHHDQKADTPSGTAIKTAELIAKAAPSINTPSRTDIDILPGSRGASHHHIPIHAIRIPGIVANQEVIFGTEGQQLTIRHDTSSRRAFMPGLLIAIKATHTHVGLVYGLESLI